MVIRMIEIRFAEEKDIFALKEIWKLCFQDKDEYIDFFFVHQYEKGKTLVLCYDGEVATMLTMISVELVLPHGQRISSTMLYAIATHPRYQGKRFSTQLMDYAKKYIWDHKEGMTILVPGSESLFSFYKKRGYQTSFYLKESILTWGEMKEWSMQSKNVSNCVMTVATAKDYNQLRNQLLKERLYVKYENKEIEYQKNLCKQSGADIYYMDLRDVQGCAAIERISPEKVIIKELLLPEDLVIEGMIQIVNRFPAKEYIVRLPADIGIPFKGTKKAFGMSHIPEGINLDMTSESLGYLGFAYD